MNVRTQGRLAGAVYLGVVVTGVFAFMVAGSRLFGEDDPALVAANLNANAPLLWANVAAGLAMSGFFLMLPFALAAFLSRYGRIAAGLMILLVAVSIPFSVFAFVQHAALAGPAGEGVVTPAMVEARTMAYERAIHLASLFWGFWLAPYGWLVLRSGAIPRVFGVLLILGCFGYLAEFFGPMINAGYKTLAFRDYISLPGSAGEIGSCLWLLVMGARGPARQAP